MSEKNLERPAYIQGILSKLDAEPLKTVAMLKNGFSKYEGSIKTRRAGFIAFGVKFYYMILSSVELRREFLKDRFFDQDKIDFYESRLLLSIFRYLLKADMTGAMYDRARIYANAMEEATAQNLDPIKIPELIEKADGIDELYKRVMARKKGNDGVGTNSESPPSGPRTKPSRSNGGDQISENIQSGGLNNSTKKPTASRSSNDRDRSEKHKFAFDRERDLAVTFPSTPDMYGFLGHAPGGGNMQFKLIHSENGPPRVEAITWTFFE